MLTVILARFPAFSSNSQTVPNNSRYSLERVYYVSGPANNALYMHYRFLFSYWGISQTIKLTLLSGQFSSLKHIHKIVQPLPLPNFATFSSFQI